VRADYVNAFLGPSVQVLQKMARVGVQVGKLARLRQRTAGNGLSIIIGLNGSVSGTIVLTSGTDVAWALASRIMRDELAPEARDDVMAVMSELANTIVGNATGHLYDLGLTEAITPPTVVMGPEVRFDFTDGVESILVPLETDVGEVDMIVSLVRRKL
jgi:CheY-specific phosphatase CheX